MGWEFELFFFNLGVDEEKSSFKRVKEVCIDNSILDNFMSDLKVYLCDEELIKVKVFERYYDKKFRLYLVGC